MKAQRIFSLICLLSLFLSACAQSVDLPQAITVTAVPTAAQSPTHTATFLPVSSPTPGETATAEPSATTEIRAFTVEEACVQISANRQDLSGEGLGRLVLERDETDVEIFRKLDAAYVYDLKSGEKKKYPGARSFVTSPDGTQMAYVKDDLVNIANGNGEILAQYPFDDIRIFEWKGDGLFTLVNLETGQLAFVNPKTGERKLLPYEYPGLDIVDKNSYWYPYVLYSPDMKQVFYTVMDTSNKSRPYHRIAFWDIGQNKELDATVKSPFFYYAPDARPEWSLDGEQIFFVVWQGTTKTYEFFRYLARMDKKGPIEILWELPENLAAMWYTPSPDDALLGYWAAVLKGEYEVYNLQILNLETGKSKDLCLSSPGITQKPIWSLDGRYLAVKLISAGNSEVYVVDLEANLAVKVADNARPVGWLK